MGKKIAAVALLLVVAVSGAFAAVTDTYLNLGLQNSAIALNYENDKLSFDFDFQADFGMIFDNGPGFQASLFTEQKFSKMALGIYYNHEIDVNNDFDLRLAVGPRFDLIGTFAIGLDFYASFILDLTQDIYISVFSGIEMDIVEFPKNRDPNTDFAFSVPLPGVSLGFKF